MATYYSLMHRWTNTKLAGAGLLLLLLAARVAAEDLHAKFAARAADEWRRTQARFHANTNDATAAWQFARACFDAAELATNATHRADFARQGIAACQAVLKRDPKSAAAHYYLAMNDGELADAEAPSLTAYRLVHDIEREFKTAADLDAHFDYAGPVRNLGQLYFQAPGWPISVGSKRKAHEWLERAAVLEPRYPENLLNLAEAQVKWRQLDDAEKSLQQLTALWPAAQTNFTGTNWERSWDDWRGRRQTITADFNRLAPEKNSRR